MPKIGPAPTSWTFVGIGVAAHDHSLKLGSVPSSGVPAAVNAREVVADGSTPYRGRPACERSRKPNPGGRDPDRFQDRCEPERPRFQHCTPSARRSPSVDSFCNFFCGFLASARKNTPTPELGYTWYWVNAG